MIKTGSVGDYDDEQFPDDERLYRRVPYHPDFVVTVDPITGKRRPTHVAFQIKGDGMSIHIDSLIRRHGYRTRDLCKWETHGVAAFSAGVIRPILGVIGNEVAEPLGKAHGLIRGPSGKPGKAAWNEVRELILADLEFFEEDPDPTTAHWASAIVPAARDMVVKFIAKMRDLIARCRD